MLLGLWCGRRADLYSKMWRSHCKDPSLVFKESATVDTAFICKTTRKDFFPMTHNDNCGKHGWFIWFIDGKVLLTGWLKNGMGCLSRQWAFMIQGDICMGREVVRSKSFTRWLGSCRDAVLSSKEKWYCYKQKSKEGETLTVRTKGTGVYKRPWKLPVFLARTNRKRLWQCSRTVIETCILCRVGPEWTGVIGPNDWWFPMLLMCMCGWWLQTWENKQKFNPGAVFVDVAECTHQQIKMLDTVIFGVEVDKTGFFSHKKMGRMPKGSSFN